MKNIVFRPIAVHVRFNRYFLVDGLSALEFRLPARFVPVHRQAARAEPLASRRSAFYRKLMMSTARIRVIVLAVGPSRVDCAN